MRQANFTGADMAGLDFGQFPELLGHEDMILSLNYSPLGDLILTASEDKTAKIWNPKIGEILKSLEGHTGVIYFANFSRD